MTTPTAQARSGKANGRGTIAATILMLAAVVVPAQVASASTATTTASHSAGTAVTPPVASASVRLPNGRYLVAGGCTPGHCPSVTTAAEIYNPQIGTAVPTGATITPHGYATLTLLASGSALLAGGCSGRLCGQLNPTAEVWNPATGTWTATGSMLADVDGITAEHAASVLLGSDEVLVAGGFNYSPIAQIWSPTTGMWRATKPMRKPRESFTLTTLTNGLVLAAGGCDQSYCETVLGYAELYHPSTSTWTSTGKMIQARYDHQAALLHTGQVQVTGGTTASGGAAAVTELYSPPTGTWTATK